MRRLTHRQRVAAIVLSVVALLFATLDLSGSGLASVHGGVSGALGALYRGTDSVLGPVRRFVQGIPSAGTSTSRIQKLQSENARLRGQLAGATADAATAAQLHTLQVAADSGGYRIVPARVIALGPGQGFDWTLTLDVGTASGVLVDQTVTDGVGLVGRVLDVSPSSCTVLLAADPGSGVGVRDERTGELGLVTGRGSSGFTLSPLDPGSHPKTGDQLRTGPVGATSYVAGLLVGTLTAVRTTSTGATSADVRPAASPTALDLVGVILVGGHAGARPALTPTPTVTAVAAPAPTKPATR